MLGGFSSGLILFAVGAVLDFAVVTTPNQHGFNIQTVGVILMIVGAIAALASMIGLVTTRRHRHRTVVDDGRGHVLEREETFT